MTNNVAILIINEVHKYEYVISRCPELKEYIDNYLIEHGRADLIVDLTQKKKGPY